MKVSLRIRIFLFVLSFIVIGHQSFATHLRAGEITVERVNCNSLTFKITVTVFTNTKNTPVKFGGDADISYIYFGDGNGEENRAFVPEIDNVIRLDLDPTGGIAMASYSIEHTYSSFGTYLIRYQEPNRNGGVLNMASSITTLFYIETLITLDPFLGCNDSPVLSVPPIDKACTGAAWSHNPGASDSDGDSLSYEMVIPNSAQNVNVVNYRDPNNASFYGSDYNTANEAGDDTPTFDIDERYGTITWDAPGTAGEYNIAFVVKEWRKIKGRYYMQGFVRRDMQIIVEDCDNERPTLEPLEELCVVAGDTIDVHIVGSDPDAHDDSVLIQAFSEVFAPSNVSPAQMFYSPPNPLVPKYEPKPTQNVRFRWETDCAHVRDQPYQVVFKITDDPPPGKGAKLATFETWTIRVVGPPPQWDGAPVLDPGTRSVQLKWDPYTCQNAEVMDVYRRVDSFDFTPDECETGIPENSGYVLIKTLPVKNGSTPVTSYLDNNNGVGLAPGAKYCYRLVARFPAPRGGESLASEEICVGPIEADAPIITNVSITETSKTEGKIELAWMKPYDVDPGQYPGPYQYRVFRGVGFSGPLDPTPVATVTEPISTMQIFMTDSLGLNTEETVYHYRVDAYANGGTTFIDSSKMASSVRVEAKSLLNKIELNWAALVPWSNSLEEDAANGVWAKHLIYRGPEGAADDELVLLDSVDVITRGQKFVDGDSVALDNTKMYCYRILTRGSYGNPDIPSPLLNFSQTVCAQPGDSTAPCTPTPPVAMTPLSCEEYIAQLSSCDNKTFTNVITWERPSDPQCRNDIAYYNIYVSSTTTGTYTLLKSRITADFYEDKNLPSFARCYKIQAVDRSENVSELSEAVCFDNCPYYELPNVFTPNLDECNGRFSAYSGNDRYLKGIDPETENPIYICGGVTDPTKCARFVERVVFHVYNRWGKEVYTYTGAKSDELNTIYIDWDGRADDGSDLASGIYYYMAEVTFISVDPSQQLKIVKGWVHLIR